MVDLLDVPPKAHIPIAEDAAYNDIYMLLSVLRVVEVCELWMLVLACDERLTYFLMSIKMNELNK